MRGPMETLTLIRRASSEGDTESESDVGGGWDARSGRVSCDTGGGGVSATAVCLGSI